MARMFSDDIVEMANQTSSRAADRALQAREYELNRRRQQKQDNIDNLLKFAQLAESGYQVTPTRDGMLQLSSNPGFVSTNELQRQKLQGDIKDAEMVRSMREKYSGGFGGQGSFGGDDTTSPMVFEPLSGKMVNNPAYLNAAERLKLEEAKIKKDMQRDMVLESARSNLDSIQAAKKGKKYFGPAGNLPSIAAPSSLFGEYGDRRNWEANVDKLLSGKIIDIMTQMKNASATGATGFGQLSNKELGVLQEASTALKRDLAPDDAMRYLDELEAIQRKILGEGSNTGSANGGADPLEAEAQAAIARGADPKAVMARLEQMRAQNGRV